MKLCRLRTEYAIVPAVYTKGTYRDLSALTPDIDPVFFASGGLAQLAAAKLDKLPAIETNAGFAPAVANPSKIVCVGLNYHDHAKEAGMEIPKEPVIFLKAPSSLSGANDPIPYPPSAQMLDWEVELAFVIGTRTKYARPEEAIDAVAGYTVLNDVSDRHWQMSRNGQWVKGKSHDGFTPVGPYLVTDVADPHALSMQTTVNGTTMQRGSTADFIFDIPAVIAHISEFMTLEPGDIVTTGTPAGVGFGMNPKVFLKPGDEVRATIEGLGEQQQIVVDN